MEIGYATARGVPVILLTTDFQDYSGTPAGPGTVFPDPLLDILATRIIRAPRLGAPPDLPGSSRFADFAARNHAQIQHAIEVRVDAALQLPVPASSAVPSRTGSTVYAESSPYTPAHHKLPGTGARPGITVRRPTRFAATDPEAATRADWAAALSSDRIVVDACGPETPPNAALLIGASCATAQPVAAYLPRSTYTHASGREPNHRNLMIQYGVGHTLRSAEEVTAWIGP
ncbi:hypothetical protein AQJ43_29465 [Streptomyces avermitilis]|nr:hypothetical protein AQJ43_29465 [Streptomyces avermitilis]BBJ47778.1 hypothetical protein SAVMC3_04070 [Streptomyces avermitilis]GDY69846.1 hypothetical protein SAV14893_092390 [Streptomyces avermitilis]GDY80114.1 hypothetical protein SAV31267_095990 [Streptomyces avermitilis]